MAELLAVENLSAGWGEGVVLQDVSTARGEGEALALLGRNGAGKTTLISALMGVARQRGGSIRLAGHRRSIARRRSVARRPGSAGCRRSATCSAR